MVERLAAETGGLHEDLEILAQPVLPHELGELPWAQAGLEDDVLLLRNRVHQRRTRQRRASSRTSGQSRGYHTWPNASIDGSFEPLTPPDTIRENRGMASRWSIRSFVRTILPNLSELGPSLRRHRARI